MRETQKPKRDDEEAEPLPVPPKPAEEDEKERRYYYDDAHGYEPFNDDDEECEEE